MKPPTKRHAPTCRCNACALERLKASNALANARRREAEREAAREAAADENYELWLEYGMGKD